MKRNSLILFAMILLLVSEQIPRGGSGEENLKPFSMGLPVLWDGFFADEPGAIGITGGSMRFENNTLYMEGVTVQNPSVVYRNVNPRGAEDGPGFGTIYRKGGRRMISGSITIEPLP